MSGFFLKKNILLYSWLPTWTMYKKKCGNSFSWIFFNFWLLRIFYAKLDFSTFSFLFRFLAIYNQQKKKGKKKMLHCKVWVRPAFFFFFLNFLLARFRQKAKNNNLIEKWSHFGGFPIFLFKKGGTKLINFYIVFSMFSH
jgi:hypothetical protein